MDVFRTRRTTLRKARNESARRDMFVADYIKHKNSDIYNEAKRFYDMLRKRYPNKANLKITKEYICWKDNTQLKLMPTQIVLPSTREQTPVNDEHSEFNDTLQLRIPLMAAADIQKETTETPETADEEVLSNVEIEPTLETISEEVLSNVEIEPSLETISEEVLSEGTILPSLQGVLSDGLLEEIIKELQSDPEINNIFSELQEEIEFDQIGMDIEIEHENLLEKRTTTLVNNTISL